MLEARPGDPVALAALERIASRTGDARGAGARWPRRPSIAAPTPAERAALAMRAAELAETAAHDLPRAAALARRALEAVPGYAPGGAPAGAAATRRSGAGTRWSRWSTRRAGAGARRRRRRRGATRARARPSRLERLGALHEERLGDPGKALALYSEWAVLGTRRPAALRALLRAAEKAGDALVAAEAALKLGTEIPSCPTRRAFAWRYRAATIYEERAAADDEAIRAYEAALALAPGFRPALAGLARAHHRRRQLEALADGAVAAGGRPSPTRRSASALEVEAARL